MFESLEARVLLTASLTNGILKVIGTAANDNISLSTANGKIYVQESVKGAKLASFDLAKVVKIVVNGLTGNDRINLTNVTAPGLIDGGAGKDVLIGGLGRDTLLGGDGNDLLDGSAGNDSLDGGAGDDVLKGDVGSDILAGGIGADFADYVERREYLVITLDNKANDGARNEKDNIKTDVEMVRGGMGNDYILGSASANKLYGWSGDDTLDGGLGRDELDGGAGADLADYSSRTDDVVIMLGAVAKSGAWVNGSPSERDYLGSSIEGVRGGQGDDTIWGSKYNDVIEGLGGNDLIYGLGGNDSLIGGDGDDTLVADAGRDTLVGGAGRDTAEYSSRSAAVRITLDGRANDGDVAAGERDNVGPDGDIEILKGGGGNDTIVGSNANDVLMGGNGDDVLDGGLGDDTLIGGGGFDWADYSSRTGNVVVTINDTEDDGENFEFDKVSTDVEGVLGGSGNDRFTGSAGNNWFIGGAGDDTLAGGAGDDTLDGGMDADLLVGGDGNDTADYHTRTEDLTLTNDGVADDGTAGEGDSISADIETLIGGSGDDSITGGAGNDRLEGGAGKDTLDGMGGDDSLDGGLGADEMRGGGGNDTADYSARTAALSITLDALANDGETGEGDYIWTDIETVLGGLGNDTITGSAGNDKLVGGAGNDQLFGMGGDDTLVGGLGADVFWGGTGSDTVDYSDATLDVSVTLDNSATDGQRLAAGSNVRENDFVHNDIEGVIGGAANDTINASGATGNVSLVGGAGNDSLTGGAGDDTLDGGLGNDTLVGGLGIDVVDYSSRSSAVVVTMDGIANDGQTALGETDNLGAGIDGVIGTDFADAFTGGAGNELFIGGAGNDTILGGAGNDTLDGGAGADVLDGQGGSDEVDYSARPSGISITQDGLADDGEAGENDNVTNVEIVIGTNFADVINGTAGNDSLDGGGGDDILDGGAGNDTLNGGSGINTLIGGADIDTVDYSYKTGDLYITLDGIANDTENGLPMENISPDIENVFGGLGNDTITGSAGDDTLRGGGGNDSLVGNGGNDDLFGDAGDDTLEGSAGDDTLHGGTGTNSVSGGAGSDTVDYTDRAGNMVIQLGVVNGTWQEVGVLNKTLDVGETPETVGADIENVWGGSGNDYIVGIQGPGALPATLIGNAGNDTLIGTTAADSLDGGAGNDSLVGNAGNDTLIASTGNDTLRGGAGDEYLRGDDGNDLLDGGDGNDTLEGGAGQDVLLGGFGSDWVIYSGRTANLVITLDGVTDDGEDTNGDGVADNEIENVGTDVENVEGGDGNDKIEGNTGDNHFIGGAGNDTLIGGMYTVDPITFLRTVPPTSTGPDFLEGGAGNDLLEGWDGNDILLGGDNDDTLWGRDGADSLDGGAGADSLVGGLGDDTLLGGAGNDILDGSEQPQVTILDNNGNPVRVPDGNDLLQGGDGNDSLMGGTGVNSLYGENGNDTLLGDIGTDYMSGGTDPLAGDIDVADYSARGDNLLISLDGQPNDGGSTGINGELELDNVADDIEAVIAGGGNDSLTGSVRGETLTGGPGRDTIRGMDGNDSIDGGAGDDRLDGGFGTDTVNGNTGTDVIDYSLRSNPVTVTLDATADDGEVGENDLLLGFENVIGGSGDDWLAGDIGANSIEGGPGNDTLRGGQGNDHLLGQQGNDYIDGGTDDDQLDGSDGNDTLDGGEGKDTISGGIGTDSLLGGSGDDSLNGDDGNDTVFGDAGNDVVAGGLGNDSLDGGADSDSLDGGAGADTLKGGSGSDWADYQFRVNNLIVTLANDLAGSVANDGEDLDGDGIAEEGDTIWFDVENVYGGQGDDLIIGNNVANYLRGNWGQDTIFGRDGDDTLRAEGGDNEVYGENGSDLLLQDRNQDLQVKAITPAYPHTNADVISGGQGTDTVDYSVRQPGLTISIDDLPDDGQAGEFDNVMTDVENVFGGSGGDLIIGSSTAPAGSSFNNLLKGNDGGDVLVGGLGADTLEGDDGGDTADYRDKINPVVISINLIFGNAQGDDGEDLNGDGFADEGDVILTDIENLAGGDGNDIIIGNEIGNGLSGRAGNDSIYGRGGNDNINGMDGDDSLYGEDGNDAFSMGAVADGVDLLVGGPGIDTADYGSRTMNLLLSIDDEAWNDGEDTDADGIIDEGVVGGAQKGDMIRTDIERVIAGTGNDVVRGNFGNDTLIGGLGHDTLYGGAGNDELRGDGVRYTDPPNIFELVETSPVTWMGRLIFDKSIPWMSPTAPGQSDGSTYDGVDQLWGGDGDDLLIAYRGVTVSPLLEVAYDPLALPARESLFGENGNDMLYFVDWPAFNTDPWPPVPRLGDIYDDVGSGGLGTDYYLGDPSRLINGVYEGMIQD